MNDKDRFDKYKKNIMLYTYQSSGEQTTYGIKGPFTLGDIITMFEYVRSDKSSIDKVATLEVNETFIFGIVCIITKIESTDYNFEQYLRNFDKSAKDRNFRS